RVEMSADGQQVKMKATPPGKEKEAPLPKQFGARLRTFLSRVGVGAGISTIFTPDESWEAGKEREFEKSLPVSDFKLRDSVQIRGREARVIEYKLTRKGPDIEVRLWLDAKTGLPVKRELERGPKSAKFRVI